LRGDVFAVDRIDSVRNGRYWGGYRV